MNQSSLVLLLCLSPLAAVFIVMKLALWLAETSAFKAETDKLKRMQHGTTTCCAYNRGWEDLTLQTNQEQYRSKKRALKAFVPLVPGMGARHPGCGKFLRALTTTFTWKRMKGTRLITEPNGKKVRDWIIRRREPKVVMTRLWFRFNDR